MALIQFFDATDTDQRHLRDLLATTDHTWQFAAEHISPENIHPDVEVISVFVSSTVSAELLERMPKLRLIACRSTGYNNIDVAAAESRGVTVVNVPSYGDRTVAEYTFTLLFALSRRLLPTLRAVQDGEINIGGLTGVDLHGKTIGLVGMGRIGQATARIAKGIGMEVIAYDPYPKLEVADEIGLRFVSFGELLEQSDIISLHTPFTGENRYLFNEETFNKTKPGVLFVNTARGELVDAKALIDALRNGMVAAAALDVFEGEKLIHTSEEISLLRDSSLTADVLKQSVELSVLRKMPNVIVTPHNAFNTYEAIERINQTTADNIIRFWFGETPNKVAVQPIKHGKLYLTRHGESEWNALGKWTGSTDVHLSIKGFKEAAKLGIALKGVRIDYAYASQQIRTLETLEGILNASQQFDVPYERVAAINERDYGDYTGKNKWEMRELLGEEMFHRLRREWDCPVPNGETLKTVYERVVPFYINEVLPKLLAGQNVLISAHGNSLRALTKYIERLSDEEIADVEMIFGRIVMYEVDKDGYSTKRQDTTIEISSNA